MGDRLDPQHDEKKRGLQSIGIMLMILGGVLSAIGLFSFFSAFNGGGVPRAFWAAFVGLPMLGLGVRIAGFGFMGEISRYASGEVGPVIKDTIDYVGDGTTRTAVVVCPACREPNDPDAVYCDSCGRPLRRKCETCGTTNDPDSKFCDNCGSALASVLPDA